MAVPAFADGRFHALADPDQEFSFNDGEIVEARWFTRRPGAPRWRRDWTNAETSDSELLLRVGAVPAEIIESWVAPDPRPLSASGRVQYTDTPVGCTNAGRSAGKSTIASQRLWPAPL